MDRNLKHVRGAAVLVTLALAVASCAGDGGSGDAAPPDSASTSTTAAGGDGLGGLDFAADSEVDLGDGWTISPCESGPPLFCVRKAGETQAVLEHMSFPAAGYESMKEILAAGGSTESALRAEAAAFHAVFEKDRPKGCGASYEVETFGPETATVAGLPGVIYGFDGRQDGRHVERALQFATIDGPTFHLITTNAVEDGTCMDDGELSEFTTSELTELQPRLARVLAASTLP